MITNAIPIRPQRRSTTPVAALLGSSRYRAVADDTLKDEDNAAWVLSLPEAAQLAWLSRIHWIRLVDRLAENERIDPGKRRFYAFREAWRRLRSSGRVDPAAPFARELSGIWAAWVEPSLRHEGPAEETATARRCVAAWDAYLDALAEYHAPEMRVRTLSDHDEMLFRLSGRIFQLVPFLPGHAWEAAGEIGRLDQFFNNVRDLHEDGESGLCYLPEDVLGRFGVKRGDVISGAAAEQPRFQRLMRFWLDEHLPALRARALPFFKIEGLHPSLRVMREWTARRHVRIERVMRAVKFDYRRFPALYWAAVRHDLMTVHSGARS